MKYEAQGFDPSYNIATLEIIHKLLSVHYYILQAQVPFCTCLNLIINKMFHRS